MHVAPGPQRPAVWVGRINLICFNWEQSDTKTTSRQTPAIHLFVLLNLVCRWKQPPPPPPQPDGDNSISAPWGWRRRFPLMALCSIKKSLVMKPAELRHDALGPSGCQVATTLLPVKTCWSTSPAVCCGFCCWFCSQLDGTQNTSTRTGVVLA